tara:strand:+ start:644 stop:868 length:225 start_codon:yes stop_codon:yes gene_type:complete
VSPLERDNLILEAALEFGPDNLYTVRAGTLGETLYIETPNKLEARYVREKVPTYWHGTYVMVLYTQKQDEEKQK